MRTLAFVLAGLLVLIQYPLWLGKGGWLRVWEIDRQVAAQRAVNAGLRERNSALEGEVNDLKQGLLAIEERARYELGMIRPDEIFVQLGEPGSIAPEGIPRQPDPVRRVAAPSKPLNVANRGGTEAKLPEGIRRTGTGTGATGPSGTGTGATGTARPGPSGTGSGASSGSGASKVSTGSRAGPGGLVSGENRNPVPGVR